MGEPAMISIRRAERTDNATVVDLWHCPSFKAMMPKAVQDGQSPDRSRLASSASSLTKSGDLYLVLDGDVVVGTLNRYGSPAEPEIGWFVAEGRRGEGIGTEAVARFVTLLFDGGADSVRFGMFGSNAASARLAGKVGLEPLPPVDGMPGGHLRYEVDAKDWEARVVAAAPVP